MRSVQTNKKENYYQKKKKENTYIGEEERFLFGCNLSPAMVENT